MVNESGIYAGIESLLWKAQEHLTSEPERQHTNRMFLGLFGIGTNDYVRDHAKRASQAFDDLVKVDVYNDGQRHRVKEFNEAKRTAIFGTLETFLDLVKLAAPSYVSAVPDTLQMDEASARHHAVSERNILSREERLNLARYVEDLFDRLSFERMAAPRAWDELNVEADYQRLFRAWGDYFKRELFSLPELVHGSGAARTLLLEGVISEDLVPGVPQLTRVSFHNYRGEGTDSQHVASPHHKELLHASMTGFESVLPRQTFGYQDIQIDELQPDDATAVDVSKEQQQSHKTFLIPNSSLRRLGYAQSVANQVMNGEVTLVAHEREALLGSAKAELELVVQLLDDVNAWVGAQLPEEYVNELGRRVKVIGEELGYLSTKRVFEGVQDVSDLKGVDTSIITARYAEREGKVRATYDLLTEALAERTITPSNVVLLPSFKGDAPKIEHGIDATPAEIELASKNAYLLLQGASEIVQGGDITTTPIEELQATANRKREELKAKIAEERRARTRQDDIAGRTKGYYDMIISGERSYDRGFDFGALRSSPGSAFRLNDLVSSIAPTRSLEQVTTTVDVKPEAGADYNPILTDNKSELNLPGVIYAGLATAAALARAAEAGVFMLPEATWNNVGTIQVGDVTYTKADRFIVVPHEEGMVYDLIGRPATMTLSNGRGDDSNRVNVSYGSQPSLHMTRIGEPGSFEDKTRPLHQRTGSLTIRLSGGETTGFELYQQRK